MLRMMGQRLAGVAASGGSQNFLGAGWVPAVIRRAPPSRQEDLALWLLSLSPHYFFTANRAAEASRNRDSRAQLTDDLLAPHLSPAMRVIDYGCGPGYMTAAVARRVAVVEAVDISRGVLACAEVLNPRPNAIYETPSECAQRSEPVDLAYSFAVVQHLGRDVLAEVLHLLHDRLRPDGTLLLHFAALEDGWRSEAEWRGDTSVKRRVKLHLGMNCFGLSSDAVEHALVEAGFGDITIESLAGRTDADPDIPRQHWAIARRM